MDSQGTVTLAQFCIDQQGAFEPAEWIARGAVDGKCIAVAAHYLSMTSWYGHDEELGHLALDLDPEITKNAVFEREVRDSVFSLAQFSRMVRYGIALRKLGGESKPAFALTPEGEATPHFVRV